MNTPSGPQCKRVRAGVAGLLGELGGLDRLVQRGRSRIGGGIEDVDVRRADARDQQEATREVGHVVALVHQRAAAGVPTEVVELVAEGRRVRPTDDLAVAVGARVDVEHRQRVGLIAVAVEGDHIGEPLGGAAAASRGVR